MLHRTLGKPRPAVTAAAAAFAAIAAGAALWWGVEPVREGVKLHALAQAFPWVRTPAPAPPAGAEVEAAASAPEAPAARPAAAAPNGPVAFDLCGLGRIATARATGDGANAPLGDLPAPVGRFALEQAQARLMQAMNAGDARQRVAARLMQQPSDDEPGAVSAWAHGLVTEALASGDAQALRWAGAACPFVDDEATCRQRLARARVQAEPANALHWLDWAHEEPARSDAAWAGLARAQYWREHPLGLAAALQGATGADVPGYVQSTLAVEAMARDAAFPAPPLSLALERCAPADHGTAGAAGRAAECERLARLLVERGDSMQALMLGRELGEHIGWPAAQLERLDDEVQALQKQEARWAVDEQRPLGCATVEAQRNHIAAAERDGELAVMRRNLGASQPGR
jgi:hypothetical protein